MKNKSVLLFPREWFSSLNPTEIRIMKSWFADGVQQRVSTIVDDRREIRKLIRTIWPQGEDIGEVHRNPASPRYFLDIFVGDLKLAGVSVAGDCVLVNATWFYTTQRRVTELLDKMVHGLPVEEINWARAISAVIQQTA